MQLIQDDIWDYVNKLDYVCITTNSIVKRDGSLVMGAGIALAAVHHNPQLPKEFGDQILAKNLAGKFYGLLVSQDKKYIAFQTKLHYRDNSPIEVVEKSCEMLGRLAKRYPEQSFGLPYPGISNGKLNPKDVYPFLINLPDNVHVYHINKLDL
jgi:hypothetical protein